MGTIYTGLDTSWYVPGIYINVELGRATPSAAAVARKELIIGNMLDPGTLGSFFEPSSFTQLELEGQVGGLFPVPDLKTAAERFGYGSELYIMAQAAFKANASVDLWAYVQSNPLTDFAAIELTVTTAPTADGIITIRIHEQVCRVRVLATDDADVALGKIADAFNAQLRELPFYIDPAPSTDSFTVSAKHPGVMWNDETFTVDLGDTGVVLNPPPTNGNYKLTGVGTTNYSLSADAFAAGSKLETKRFHYIVISPNDYDNVQALGDFLMAQADPLVGFRQQGVFGTRDSFNDINGEYKTDPTTPIQNPRIQCAWAYGNLYFPCQLAAAVASMRAKWESSDPAVNLCFRPVPKVPLTDSDDLLTQSDKNAAITAGFTPLVPHEGSMTILRSVTMADVTATYSVLDTGKVTVSDYLADDIQIKMANRYKGFKLSPDTDIPLPSRTTTPSNIRQSLLEWLRENEAQGMITRVSEFADDVRVEMDPNIDGRVNFEIPEDVVDIFAVGAGNIIQIG